MTTVLIVAAVGKCAFGVLALASRCGWGWHGAVIMRQKRGADGRCVRPHLLQWECERCQQVIGETAIVTNRRIPGALRKQARLRREA